MSLRWTKLQDFCLRLGLLKVLVASLPTSRTTRSRTKVLQKLKDLLFRPVHDELLGEVRDVLGVEDEDPVESVAEALLITSGAGSWGQPIKENTVYKLLEWGQTTGLVAKGNRISERGLMLRSLFDTEASRSFIEGDVTAWNPFDLTGPERVFFFYHLGEKDEVLWRMAYAVGRLGSGYELTVSDDSAYEITLSAMKKMIGAAEGNVSIPDLPRLRTLRELTGKIDRELHPDAGSTPAGSYGPPTPKRLGGTGGRNRQRDSSSKKNADHQTIPRFEQLADMGFVDKPVEASLKGTKLTRAKKSWTFVVTEEAEDFARGVDGAGSLVSPDWRWNGFGKAVGASGIGGGSASLRLELDDAIECFVASYKSIRRRAGHTPFESVAILTLIRALAAGSWFEIGDLHQVFLQLKKQGVLEKHVHFAAGNEIGRMFIELKPEFLEAWKRSEETARLGWENDG